MTGTVSAFHNSVSQRDQWLTRLGATIREARIEAGLNQSELADQIHMSRSGIANIEAGRCDLPTCKAAQLIALLHMNIPGWTLEPNDLTTRLQAAETEAQHLRQALHTIRGVLRKVDSADTP